MKACCRSGKERSLNLLASLLKQTALGSVTKSPEALGGLVVGFGSTMGGMPAPTVRLALALLPPAAVTLLTSSCIVSAEAVCDLQNETFLLVVCYGYSPSLDLSSS